MIVGMVHVIINTDEFDPASVYISLNIASESITVLT